MANYKHSEEDGAITTAADRYAMTDAIKLHFAANHLAIIVLHPHELPANYRHYLG